MDKFKNVNHKLVKGNILQDTSIECYCYKVYDADTISILYDIKDIIPSTESLFLKTNLRLIGIDSVEIKSKVKNEKSLAVKARDYLSDKILNKLITVKTYKIDKYGRMLAEVFINNINMNEDLIKGGFVRTYDGKKKDTWNIDNELQIINNKEVI